MSSKAYFDAVAGQWDAMRSQFFSEAVREKAIAAAGVQPGAVVADIGAGAGFVTAGLVQRGARVVAVDQSPAMLEQMRANFPGADIAYRAGDAARLPIDDASMDAAFANMFLHHVDDPAAAIQEMARTLKPGGRLVITDLDTHSHEFLRTEQHDCWLGFDRADVKRWFTDAGLESVSVDCTNEKCCASAETVDNRASVSIFLATGTKPAHPAAGGEDIHAAVRDHYGAIARRAGASSCCGAPSDVIAAEQIGVGERSSCSCDDHAAALYGAKSLADLPADVTGLSLGCGDPVTIASLRPGETVLDLGSGGGIDCFLAARQVGPDGYVIGVDMTPEMLARANANKARLGTANVEFRQGQIEALPVDDGSVDVVMSNCVINLSPDKAAVFREAFRALRPSGRISVSDIVTEGAFSNAQRADLDQWAGCVSGAIDVEAYTGLMRAAGFVDVQVRDKIEAGAGASPVDGVPRVYSARVTGRKPM